MLWSKKYQVLYIKKETTIGAVHTGKGCTRKSCPLSLLIRPINLYQNPTITSPRGGGTSLTQLMSRSYLPDFVNKLQMLVR